MRVYALIGALAIIFLCGTTIIARAEETAIRVGNIDAVLTTPANVERPVVALLIAGSGTTDHDGNGPQARPGTLKKLAGHWQRVTSQRCAMTSAARAAGRLSSASPRISASRIL